MAQRWTQVTNYVTFRGIWLPWLNLRVSCVIEKVVNYPMTYMSASVISQCRVYGRWSKIQCRYFFYVLLNVHYCIVFTNMCNFNTEFPLMPKGENQPRCDICNIYIYVLQVFFFPFSNFHL